jgi:hypothetical protein
MGRVIGVKRSDLGLLKDVGKMALAAAAAGLVTIAARVLLPHARPFITLIACGAVFSVAYLSIFLLSGILTRDEWSTIRRQLARLRRVPGGRAGSLLTEGDY